ncbi:MAG: hypothetical protein IPK59_08625 [Rhodospirillaceae bacterium]|nr:hypothetical protein [Rhodospirillaceae bacterium]
MRKLFLTLISLCFLAGLAVAGLAPLPMPHAHAVMVADQGNHCDHPAPQKPAGHVKMDCCAAGYCPMLSQGTLPTDSEPVQVRGGHVLHPEKATVWSGLASAPSLRPPRSFS